jgi:4-hydroxy-tetrahydrodipicolinate synthase
MAIFKGAGVALITPFHEDGSVNYDKLAELIEEQVEGGTDAIIACGTTGEASTMSEKEHMDVVRFIIEKVAHRIPVIAGTGSNCTATAIELSKQAEKDGADGVLLVTPYYNKATQNGLIKTFTAIADESTKPCLLYNVPSRTGVNIEPATYGVLADHPMITGIKEASGNISKIVETMAIVGDKLDLYSGNDDQVIPLLSLGGSGVISVLSNVLPKETSQMCHKFFDGDIEGALKMQLDYLPLINALFCEVNPIPVKAAMAAMGFGEDYLRLPLTPMEDAHKQNMLTLMRQQGLNV